MITKRLALQFINRKYPISTKFIKPSSCLFRPAVYNTPHLKLSTSSINHVDFPWNQKDSPYKPDSWFNMIAAQMKFTLMMWRLGEAPTIPLFKDFFLGVEGATKAIAQSFTARDGEMQLKGMVGEDLYREILASLKGMCSEEIEFNLDIDSIDEMEIIGARWLTDTPVRPGEQTMTVLGHQYVKADVYDPERFADYRAYLGYIAAKQWKYQIDVALVAQERFTISKKAQILKGTRNSVRSVHKLKFETLIPQEVVVGADGQTSYPLNWIVVDIDNTMANKLKKAFF